MGYGAADCGGTSELSWNALASLGKFVGKR